MILLGITVETSDLKLTIPERTALSVLSSAIATGECICGGTWEMLEDEDSGVPHPNMVHQEGCPGTSRTGQSAVHKIIRHVVYKSMMADTGEDD